MTEPISITLPADSRTGWFDVRNAEVAGRSMYAIVRRGDLYLKTRVTIPHAAGDAGLAAVAVALRDLPWAATGADTAGTELTQGAAQVGQFTSLAPSCFLFRRFGLPAGRAGRGLPSGVR